MFSCLSYLMMMTLDQDGKWQYNIRGTGTASCSCGGWYMTPKLPTGTARELRCWYNVSWFCRSWFSVLPCWKAMCNHSTCSFPSWPVEGERFKRSWPLKVKKGSLRTNHKNYIYCISSKFEYSVWTETEKVGVSIQCLKKWKWKIKW